jgi:type VI secretion system Hcp family effector
MKRAIWIGAAVVLLLAAAPALWLVLGDDTRRAGALVEPTAGGEVGKLVITGAQSGVITVPVQSFTWGLQVPTDPVTGAASGRRRYQPLQILRPIDATTPQLFNLIVKHEAITSAKLDLMTTAATGKPLLAASYTFRDAILSEWNDKAARGMLQLAYQSVEPFAGKGLPAAQNAVGQMTLTGESPVPITDFEADVTQPLDAASGLATGKRVHKPVTITRAIDSLMPKLVPAAETNKPYAQLVVELQRTNAEGKPETYAKYTFGNVRVILVEDSGAGGSELSERLQLVYQSLEVQAGTNVAQDSLSVGAS